MTTKRLTKLNTLILTLALALAPAALAQDYDIDWYTIDGGGGTSIGDVFELSGTIGQPDAGVVMTAGDFSLTGGFWIAPGTAGPPCPADITGDGVVDVLDLLEVLSQWGTTGSADINEDGTVDVLDLLEVLSAWGSC